MEIAIIDIGSNTIRLVIYRIKSENIIKEIENIKVTARLHSYLDHRMYLNSEGQNILVETLGVFKEIISVHNVTSIKVVATAAIRKAKNQEETLKMVRDKIGFSIKILSGQKEAYYGFLGVSNAVNLENGILIDLGGGSVEITQFIKRKIVHCHSFPFGVITLNEQFVKNKVPTSQELENISTYLQSNFKQIEWLINCELPIIGIGGSARNIAEIDQAIKSYPIHSTHQYEMNVNDILLVKRQLTGLPFEELQGVAGLSKERSDIIIPAIEVFLSIYSIVNAPIFLLSQKGIRDGILYEQIKENHTIENDHDVLQRIFYQIAMEYGIDLEKRKMVYDTTGLIFSSIRETGIADVKENDLNDLGCASYCYGIGEIIAKDSACAHTFYILANKNVDRLSHRDRIKIALLASYQSRTSFKNNIKPFKEWFTKNDREKLRFLGAILKLSYTLNNTKRAIVQDVRFIKGKDYVNLEIYCNKSWKVEQNEAEKQIKHLENALGLKINLNFKLINQNK